MFDLDDDDARYILQELVGDEIHRLGEMRNERL